MQIKYLAFFLILISCLEAEAQKKPVQTQLFNTTLGPGLTITTARQAFADICPSVNNSFYWIHENHIEKRLGNDYLGRHRIERRRGDDLQLIDSLQIDGNVKVFDAESDQRGNLYLSLLFMDSLNLPGYDTLYPSALPSAMLKIDSNLDVVWLSFNSAGSEEFTVTPDGSRIYLRSALGGFGGNVSIDQLDSAGNYVRTKTLNGIGYLQTIKATSDGSLYLSGGCSDQNAVIDSINFGHSFSYSLYYAKLDSSLKAEWVVNMDDITCDVNHLGVDPLGNVHFFARMNKSVQIGSVSLTKPPQPYDDFIYTSTDPSGSLNYARESTFNTSSLAFITKNSLAINGGAAALVMNQEWADTINWGGALQTISKGNRDVIILEYDFNGNLIAASSYPSNANIDVGGVYYGNDSSVVTAGHVNGFAIDDYYQGTITTTYDQFFLQRWDVPLSVGLSDKHSSNKGLSIYPNPSNGEFSFSEKVSGRVLDMQGRVILEFNQVNQISLVDYPDGLYFLQTSEGEVFKLVKR